MGWDQPRGTRASLGVLAQNFLSCISGLLAAALSGTSPLQAPCPQEPEHLSSGYVALLQVGTPSRLGCPPPQAQGLSGSVGPTSGRGVHGQPQHPLSLCSPDLFTGPQACTQFFSGIAKANVDVLPRGAPERRQLLLAALACQVLDRAWGKAVRKGWDGSSEVLRPIACAGCAGVSGE